MRSPILESNGVTYFLTELNAELLCDSSARKLNDYDLVRNGNAVEKSRRNQLEIEVVLPGDGNGGNSTWLSDCDFAIAAAVKHLRELSALAGPRLPDDNHNGVPLNGFDNFFFILDYGKRNHPVPRLKAVEGFVHPPQAS